MVTMRSCPICRSPAHNAKLFLDENIDESRISSFTYASRKEPEYMCHRLVKCNTCDLVYVSNPPNQIDLAHAYHVAQYDSSEEANDAALAYIKALRPILLKLHQRGRVLEIGSGTGVLLELLKQEGFSELVGVEPSTSAIAAAPKCRQAWLRKGVFNEEDFTPESFDLICCFMTMEHVRDPDVVASAAFRLLRSGGAFVTVTHDYHSLVNRLLGKHSPIIDIEHMQLFCKRSVRRLFVLNGFSDITVNAFVNSYSLRYWMRLVPLPRVIKYGVKRFMEAVGLSNIKIRVNVGNLIASGFKRD